MDRRTAALTAAGLAGSLGAILYLTLVADQPVFWFSVVILGCLMVICESLGEEMPGGGRSTYGLIAIFAAIAALNTPSAMIVALCGALHLRLHRLREEGWNMAYDAAMYSLATLAASAVYHALGGNSHYFTLRGGLRSVLPALAAAAVFWCLNAAGATAFIRWERNAEPLVFLKGQALRLLPNQLLYGLVGLGAGMVYAQNAFHVILDLEGNPALDQLGNPVVVGSTAEYLRGLFAALSLMALLGVAWYFSGKNIELLDSYDRTLETLVTYLEKREPYLEGHSVRVAEYALMIADEMQLPLHEKRRLRHAALLHDLGRPAIPLRILLQPGPLSEEEFEKVKVHPLEGASRLEEVEYLSDMAEAVRHHHEHYDGGGYIDSLSGDTIPLSARIIAVADAYEAMLHERPHRGAKDGERTLAELRQNSGRQFDPRVVEHLAAALGRKAAGVPRREAEAGPAPTEGPVSRGAPETAEEAAAASPRFRGPRGRRARRREEMLRARREVRERLEREALRRMKTWDEEVGGEGDEDALKEGTVPPPESGGEGGEEG